MTRDELKIYIQQHALNRAGKINSKFRVPPHIAAEILAATALLEHSYALSARMQLILRDVEQEPVCPVCGVRRLKFTKYLTWSHTCSRQCAVQNPARNARIQSSIDYAQVVRKRKSTALARYGVEHTTQLDSVKQKIKQSNLQKYGVENVSQSTEIKTHKQQTRNKTFKDSVVKQAHFKRVGANISQALSPNCNVIRANIESLLAQKTPVQIANHYNVGVSTVYKIINEHTDLAAQYIRSQANAYEQLVCSWLDQAGVDYQTHNRSQIAPLELDIFVAEHSLAIEINGWYWHSDRVKSSDYHLKKTKLCQQQGIRLMHLWDLDLDRNPDLFKSMVLSAVKHSSRRLAARKCHVQSISAPVYQAFLLENHHQGAIGSTVRYGLYCQQQLVAVAGFSPSRYNSKYQWELMRFCVAQNTVIAGGASRLITAFAREHTPRSIVSYCDRSLFTGAVYGQSGFVWSHNTRPGYCYVRSNQIVSRQAAQKHRLSRLLEHYDPTLSESELMSLNGYVKIWNCGNSVWTWSAHK